MAVGPVSGNGRSARLANGAAGLEALAPGRRKRWPRRLLIAANLVVLALLALGASAYGYVQWRFGQVDRIPVSGLTAAGKGSQSPAGAGSPLTILVVGSDTRDLGKGASAAFGSAEEVSGQRSDTIMLVRVVPATSSIALLSVPRDLLVPVPGLGTTRINAAFAGGPDLLVQTVQDDLGIQVNHFVVVNFVTFTQIANSLGGVYQYFPAPARDLWSNLVVAHAGCVLLKGSQALAFVRSREYQYYLDGQWQYQMVPESDLARIQRQQDFIKLAMKKAEEIGPTNPLALNDVISGITKSLTVDNGLSSSLMLNLALDMRHVDVADIPNWTYPTVNSTQVPGALGPVPYEDQQIVSEFLGYGLPKPGPPSARANAPAAGSVTVEVLNGSGITGQAGQAAIALRQQGYKVSSTGDASSYNYKASVVEYGPSGLEAARSLLAKLEGSGTLEKVASLKGENLVLVTGQSYSGIAGTGDAVTGRFTLAPARGAPADRSYAMFSLASALVALGGPTTPPVDPGSSSYYEGRYVPPGLAPGQVPQNCPG